MFGDMVIITTDALQGLVQGFLNFIPLLLGAIIVFIIGWIIAVAVGKITATALTRLKFNELFNKSDWQRSFEKAKLTVNPSEFLGAIVKWILVIVFLSASAEILGLTQFAVFLTTIVNYLPDVFVAALIFVVAVILADIAEKIVVASTAKMEVGYSSLVGIIAKWSIWIFAILAILYQLGVVRPMIQTLFAGFITMFAIAFGLAFGLGGKNVAAEILEDLKEKFKKE